MQELDRRGEWLRIYAMGLPGFYAIKAQYDKPSRLKRVNLFQHILFSLVFLPFVWVGYHSITHPDNRSIFLMAMFLMGCVVVGCSGNVARAVLRARDWFDVTPNAITSKTGGFARLGDTFEIGVIPHRLGPEEQREHMRRGIKAREDQRIYQNAHEIVARVGYDGAEWYTIAEIGNDPTGEKAGLLAAAMRETVALSRNATQKVKAKVHVEQL